MRSWQLATVALCAVEGAAGVLLSVELNAPPGRDDRPPGGLVFAVAAVVATARRHGARPGRPLARWAAAGASIFLIAGCGSDDGAGGDGGSVVATTPIVGDLVANVAGDDVEVTTLLAANTDPHEYEPRPDDIEALASADLVDRERRRPRRVDRGRDRGLGLRGRAARAGRRDPAPDARADPHWWHDPRNAAAAVAAIGDALAGLDPEAASAIEERARRTRRRDRGRRRRHRQVPGGGPRRRPQARDRPRRVRLPRRALRRRDRRRGDPRARRPRRRRRRASSPSSAT